MRKLIWITVTAALSALSILALTAGGGAPFCSTC